MTRWHELAAYCQDDHVKLTLIELSANAFGEFRLRYICPKCGHEYKNSTNWLAIVEMCTTLNATERRLQ